MELNKLFHYNFLLVHHVLTSIAPGTAYFFISGRGFTDLQHSSRHTVHWRRYPDSCAFGYYVAMAHSCSCSISSRATEERSREMRRVRHLNYKSQLCVCVGWRTGRQDPFYGWRCRSGSLVSSEELPLLLHR